MASVDRLHDFKIAGSAKNAAVASLTDSTGGSAGDTLVESAGANPTAAEFENNCASLGAKINAILAVLRAEGLIDS